MTAEDGSYFIDIEEAGKEYRPGRYDGTCRCYIFRMLDTYYKAYASTWKHVLAHNSAKKASSIRDRKKQHVYFSSISNYGLLSPASHAFHSICLHAPPSVLKLINTLFPFS